MSIGTVPQQWANLDAEKQVENEPPTGSDMSGKKDKREERIERTKVCILDYLSDEVEAKEISTASMLRKELNQVSIKAGVQFRLYVVEDLSREVIEALGHNRTPLGPVHTISYIPLQPRPVPSQKPMPVRLLTTCILSGDRTRGF